MADTDYAIAACMRSTLPDIAAISLLIHSHYASWLTLADYAEIYAIS